MQKMLKSTSILLLVYLIVWGCSPQQQNDQEQSAIPVKIQKVNKGQVLQTLSYNGDIEAEYMVKVFSKIPDRIQQFFVDEGDQVKKGDPIAKIYAATIEQGVRQAEAALVAAQAQFANAQVEYERAQRLYSENAMSKQQYDGIQTQWEAAKAGLEQAQAALKSVKSQLDDASVTAPIAGVIGIRNYEEGDMANPALPLVTIVQMDRVTVTFDATERDLGKLQVGQSATIKVKSYDDVEFTGELVKISPVLDPLTRMAKVEIIIDNPDHRLKPGMFASIIVTVGNLDDVIIVPRYAVIENTTAERIGGKDEIIKNYYVFVEKADSVQQRKLHITYATDRVLAVNQGLQQGENIVIQGQQNLRDGSTVTVIEEE
jgi:RND family efflux transporter MFP subunit